VFGAMSAGTDWLSDLSIATLGSTTVDGDSCLGEQVSEEGFG